MAEIIIEMDDKGAQDLFRRIAEAGKDTSSLTAALAGDLHDEVMQNFEEEGRPKWLSLAPATIRNRARTGHWPGKILERRGALKRSIVPSHTPDEAVVSTNKVYAAVQHFGHTFQRMARSEFFVRQRSNGGRNEKRRKGAFTGREQGGQGRTIGEHSVTIPARPFMSIPAGGVRRLIKRAATWWSEQLMRR